ncbi:MAG: HAMP domain-containing histidine kinase [Candidatus Cloacimonetes bacterium]|nr:HAMP domain-containing histidine kinase [Candidatus Cloacimonadota bacterium]
MKVNLNLRVIVIFLFLFLYLSSLMILNVFFNSQQKEIDKAYKNFHIDEVLAELSFKTQEDSLQARQLAVNIRESLMAIDLIRNETQVYSTLFLILLMIASIIAFVLVFYRITKPLKDLQLATARIREGDFSVYLPTSGIKEMRLLQQSFNDMSHELDNTQKKLLQAEKEMIWKELSRMLAHEIKNPLTPIQLSIQRLEEKYEDCEKLKEIFPEAIRIINQEVNNLRELVQSFSNFAKISTPNLTVFDPATEIEKTVEPYIHNYNIQLNLTKNTKIQFDQTHFYQIITNILQNAADASSSEEEIVVSLKKSNNFLVVEIKDYGQGIDPDDISHIFDPYFSRKKRGTGLGLAVVKRLCDANSAHIRVKSKLNQGTTFEIIIEEYK